jgi:hypothetical protein
MRTKLIWLAVVVFIVVVYRGSLSEVRYGPGVIAPTVPQQRRIPNPEPFQWKGYTFTPLATFEVEARVLSKERYWLGREAELSPIDLALGWGPMSNEAVLDEIKISQGGRFYHWWTDDLPIPTGVIASHSANMHLIPANVEVMTALKRARKGSLVEFSGFLVSVQASDGWRWRSSLTRTDAGHGACELVWVERMTVRYGVTPVSKLGSTLPPPLGSRARKSDCTEMKLCATAPTSVLVLKAMASGPRVSTEFRSKSML